MGYFIIEVILKRLFHKEGVVAVVFFGMLEGGGQYAYPKTQTKERVCEAESV